MIDRTSKLKQLIGQMVVVRASGYLFDRQIRYPVWEPPNSTLRRWLETLNLGGVILLGGSAAEIALRTRQLQDWSPHPLLIAADIEEGVGQRFAGATWFPPPMALGEIAKKDVNKAKEYAFRMGAITAREALSIGINWVLAPIVDVNNNPENPVINIRAFGETPEIVSELARSFILGARSYPVLTTAKHFPGHGDTGSDSHLDLPVLEHDLDRLETLELPPFQAAIETGVDSVMSGHLLIPAWDREHPATLSRKILTERLREKMGFDGIIVTDALIMGGVTKVASPAEVAVMAVEAGADILLMPPDPEVAIEAVYKAVTSGRISEERILESIARIRRAKEKLGPPENSIELLFDLGEPRAIATVEAIVKDSCKIGGNLPLETGNGRNLIIVDDLLNCDFLDRSSPAVTIPRQAGYEVQTVDRTTLKYCPDDDRSSLLQLFLRGNPFRGSAGLTEENKRIYRALLETGRVRGMIIYGSPYVFAWFRSLIDDDLPIVFTYSQEAAAQKIACEKLFGLSSPSGDIDREFV
ncbi:glycoside hydrolase family 3 N-terminal domain-containing protein [Pannus brasiliensis CCIBt3594]|uniref:beta-N-acetylhexosaminidase n=1 Tax=Pannus brasiliensis CCIBt3594 TaxID=1427578 RepID=A0AAW9QRJ3_9CHRO